MICPIHGNDIVPNCNFCIGRETGEITIDRLRIVRNSIVRKWQRTKKVMEELPQNAASKEHLRREMGGLMAALEEMYHEFDELERIPLDQKPMCPFCGEEMDPKELGRHITQHLKNGDELTMTRGATGGAAHPNPDPPERSFQESVGMSPPAPNGPMGGHARPGHPMLVMQWHITRLRLLNLPFFPCSDGMVELDPSSGAVIRVGAALRSAHCKADDMPKNMCLCVESSDTHLPTAGYGDRIIIEKDPDYPELINVFVEAGGQGGAAHPDPDPSSEAESYQTVTKDPDDPDETMDCTKCGFKVKLSTTVRRKVGNELHVRWKCLHCGQHNEGMIILGPLHSTMAGGQGGAAHPDPDPPAEDSNE